MEAVGSAWERSLRRAGIERFRFHDLRYTGASWHVVSGTHLQELLEWGGWKSFEMVRRCTHSALERLSSAAKRIERTWQIVCLNPTNSPRQA
jgi:integrase